MGSSYTFDVAEDRERNLTLPKIVIRQHGIDNEYVLHYDFITSIDYGRISALGESIRDLIEEGGFFVGARKSNLFPALSKVWNG